MKNKLPTSASKLPRIAALGALLLVAQVLPAKSAVIYSEDFVGPNNTLPAGWTSTGSASIQGDMLRYSSQWLTTYTEETFSEFQATWEMKISHNVITTADQGHNFYFGYNASRAPEVGPIAYSVGVRSFSLNGQVFLTISPQPQGRYNSPYLSRVRIDTLTTLDSNATYTITVEYDGNSIQAAIYDGALKVAEVSHSTGISSITGNIGFYGVSTSLTDSITLNAIPEPSTYALCALSGLLLVSRKFRSRRVGTKRSG